LRGGWGTEGRPNKKGAGGGGRPPPPPQPQVVRVEELQAFDLTLSWSAAG